jgi:hypothetical protein
MTIVTAKRMLSTVLVLVPILVFMRLIAIENMSSAGLLLTIGLMAIPITIDRLEYRLFSRRAVLAQGCTEDGLARKLLWNGTLLKISSYIAALFISALILIVAVTLNDKEWAVIYVATVLLVALDTATLPLAMRQAHGDFLPVFHRALIKWPVLVLVVVASSYLVFNVGYPVYIDHDIAVLVQWSFEEQLGRFTSPLLGYTYAFLSAADTSVMYLAQNYVPRIESTAVKWVIWLYFSLKAAISTGLLIYLLLGGLTLLSIKERKGWRVLGESLFEKYFTLTLICLFAIYFYAVTIHISPKNIVDEQKSGKCDAALSALQSTNAERTRKLSSEEKTLKLSVEHQIDREITSVFSLAESRVDTYLDWYFSVMGEYERLGASVAAKFASESPAKFDRLITDNINTALQSLNLKMDAEVLERINASAKGARFLLPEELPFIACLSKVNLGPLVFEMNAAYVGKPQALFTGGAIAAITAKKAAAKVGVKAGTKLAGKWGSSVMAGLAGASLCGPYAPICGAGAALFAWIAVDAAVVTADEILNRDELRDEIFTELNRQKRQVRDQMVKIQHGAISGSYDIIERRFTIPKDGF